MQKINQKYIKSVVYRALREDLSPSGDITTKNIINKNITAKIIAGQNCVIGGLNFTKEAFKISDKKIIFKNGSEKLVELTIEEVRDKWTNSIWDRLA